MVLLLVMYATAIILLLSMSLVQYISCLLVEELRGVNTPGSHPVAAGVYLPLLWESSFCWKSPIALAYTRGHFSALVSIAYGDSSSSSANAWSNDRSHDHHLTYLPLVDSEGKRLPLHFLTELEVGERVWL